MVKLSVGESIVSRRSVHMLVIWHVWDCIGDECLGYQLLHNVAAQLELLTCFSSELSRGQWIHWSFINVTRVKKISSEFGNFHEDPLSRAEKKSRSVVR